MKKIKTLLLLFSIVALGLTSCKKDSETTAEANAALTVKVNGTAKSSTGPVVATIYQSEKTLQILGQFSTTEGVSIMIQDFKVGEFNVATDDVLVVYTNGTTGSLSTTFMGDTGKVKITSITDTKVTGTFEFVGSNDSEQTKTLTEGKFEASIVKI